MTVTVSINDEGIQGNADTAEKERIRDSEPRTGDTSHVEVYATAAMVTGLLYVRLYFTADKTEMTQEEKEQFLSFLISWAKKAENPEGCSQQRYSSCSSYITTA